jgi:catalase
MKIKFNILAKRFDIFMKNKFYFQLSSGLVFLSLISCSSISKDMDIIDTNNIINANSNNSKIVLDTQLGEKLYLKEAEKTKMIEDTILSGLKKEYQKPPVHRDVHAKHHGCVKSYFKVNNSNLPEKYRVGVFSQNKEYQSFIRFSNGNGKPKPDKEGDVRGFAIKLMGVPGKKLLENEVNEQTQDFLLINAESFFIENLEDYTDFIKATDQGLSSILKFAVLHPKVSYRIYQIFKQQITSPLETNFFSSTPYKLGTTAVKYKVSPCGSENTKISSKPSDNYLRENMSKTLKQKDACFNFYVQLNKGNFETMPIEDATKLWDAKTSPYIQVAQINIPKQEFESKEQMQFCEDLSFTPWHSLPEHKPLGATNRVRKTVYETISNYRHTQNGVQRKEPNSF